MHIQTRLDMLAKQLETSLEDQKEINFKPIVALQSLKLHEEKPNTKEQQSQEQTPESLDYFAIVSSLFQLTENERIILLFAIAREIYPHIISCLSALNNTQQENEQYLSLGALSRIHPKWSWKQITPEHNLRCWNLIRFLEPNKPLYHQEIKLDEQILHFVSGRPYADSGNRIYFKPISAPLYTLPDTWQQLVNEITTLWYEMRIPMNIMLTGRKTFLPAMLSTLCAQQGYTLYKLAFAGITDLHKFWQQLKSANRDARLYSQAFYIDLDERPHEIGAEKFIHQLQQNCECPLFFASREPLDDTNTNLMNFPVPPISIEDQIYLWQAFLGEAWETEQQQALRAAQQFTLTPEQIGKITTRHLALKNAKGEEQSPGLWELSRRNSRQSLQNLAERIEGKAAWEQIVLPERIKSQLRYLADQVKYRYKVYHDWGFQQQTSHGLGINALFHGTSGTGKTLAASAIAEELKLDLYRIDLSQVINKYIGETEKHLSQVFDLAENSGAILLFDEADALFGKRSEVNDSKDRHANVQVSYLLQRLDSFTGIALLTTNFKDNLDDAFVRRFRFIIGFPLPNKEERKIMWQKSFPKGAPRADLNYDRLAQLSLTGSHIRNIAVQAAFIAAQAETEITMEVIKKAVELEYGKMEKPVGMNEFKNWGT